MKNRYRVVRDRYLGYEAQVKYWWFPFSWFQMSVNAFGVNTFGTFERAANFIKSRHRKRVKTTKWKREVYPNAYTFKSEETIL